ncbi:MAG: sugar ABC transporter permease [Desulfitibacter sp. BRH_c19]|nr:MAG: sugar ABC transporter permease [Desulfitibacter sp. BRH_c19]
MKIKFNNEYFLSLIAVVLGLIAGSILMLVAKSNPVEGYIYLFQGGTMNIERIGNSLATATPLIFTGLSVAFAFKTGLFNIGAAGQMLIGGLCSTAIGLTFAWPKPILLIVMLLAAMIGGGLWGALPGLLKSKYNVHEVVSTIMMNWIAYWTVYYTIPAYFKGQFLETESRRIPYEASLKVPWLTDLFYGSYINLGLFLAILFVIIIAFILNKTTLGYELKAVGYNRHAAETAGINVNRSIILSMVIAGALAGLAGATFYVGYASNMQIGVLPSHGFDGIAVALLGANSPVGVMVSAIFFGLLHTGKGFMNAMTSIPPEIADTIIATIIYFSATSILIQRNWDKLKKKLGGAK